MATEPSSLKAYMGLKNKSSTRLLRKPLAPVTSQLPPHQPSSPPKSTHTPSPTKIFSPNWPGTDSNAVSPPPPQQRDNSSEPQTPCYMTRSTISHPVYNKEDLKYVLDVNCRERTALGTYVEGRTLTKPYRPRGPQALPARQPATRYLPPNVIFDEDDIRYYQPPEFTLKDFLYKVSENANMSLEKATEIIMSRHNYKQIQKILCRCMNPPAPDKVSQVELTIPEEAKIVSPRIPQRQLLLEMAALVKQEMSHMLDVDMKPRIRRLPQYSPSYKPGQDVPHTEIVLYEEEKRDAQQRSIESSEVPARDSIFCGANSQYFQGSRRSNSPFANTSGNVISPSEVAILDSLVSGGTALSLKAHFIHRLPDIDPLSSTITYLNLSFNDFRIFPFEITEMIQLHVLKMRNNPLKEIPPEISRLKRLKIFSASFCMISTLPLGLFECKRLEHLNLAYNKISYLPNEIQKLKRLTILDVSGNQLPAMPAGCLRFTRLKKLAVGNNFMHPYFWKENTQQVPQRLLEMSAVVFKQNNLDQLYPNIPDHIQHVLDTHTSCDCCQGPLYGPGMRLIRPVSSIFGVRNLPIIFCCCTSYCSQLLSSNSEMLLATLYGREVKTWPSVA